MKRTRSYEGRGEKPISGRFLKKIVVNRGNLNSWLFLDIRTENRKGVTGALGG
jgi:hypothetical protein